MTDVSTASNSLRTATLIKVGGAAFTTIVGSIVLLGWLYGIIGLTQILPGLTAMNPITALALIIAGSAMLLHARANVLVIGAMSALVSLAGLTKFLQLTGAIDFPIDQLLFPDKLDDAIGVPANRMAPNTAFTLIITGLAIASSKARSTRIVLVSQAFCTVIMAITLFALIGYTLGVIELYGFKAFNPMALHAACALMAIALAVLSANPNVGILRVIGDRGPAGQLSRRALPLVVFVPVVVGILRLEGQKLGYFSSGTGVALQVFGNVVVTFSLLMMSIMWLFKSDTERRIRELSVKRSEAEYRLAEHLGRVGHWRFDLRTLQLECSAEMLIICGLPEGARLSRHSIMAAHHRDDASLQRRAILRGLRKGRGWDANRRIIWSDGQVRTIRSHGEVETNEHGRPVSLFGVFVEITELEKSRQQAEAASAVKAEFLANMSHEIRTPLNSIIGFTDLMLDDSGLASRHRHQLELVRNSGGALLTVVNDILDFSKMEAGKVELAPRPFDLAYLVQSTVAIIHQSATAKGLTVTVSIDEELSHNFIGDDSRLRQILLNLLSNAVKFTDDGDITLSVGKVCVPTGEELLSFVVADSGVGIAEGQEELLFQQFSQTNPSICRQYGGTGLGLAICKRLVILMGGEIDFRRRSTGGSEFWFNVDFQPTSKPVARRNALRPATPQSQLYILLVEDVAVNQELAVAMLTRGGHQVRIASNGREAITAVQEQDFDLVLMDIQMPIMDGITATKLIRIATGKARSIPIIALTANILPEQIETFRQAGMNDHVSKPINMAELAEAIARNVPQGKPEEAERVADRKAKDADFDEDAYRQLTAMLAPDRLKIHSASFQATIGELCRSDLSPDEQRDIAHSMITQAGMFGFSRFSALCREFEVALVEGRPAIELAADLHRAAMHAHEIIDALQNEKAPPDRLTA